MIILMENTPGSQHQEFIQTNQPSASSNNAQIMIPSLEYPQAVSMDWTPQEQATLEGALAMYASESVILRYAKIALLLKNKTVRDVAFRCRWMRSKENSKKIRKEDFRLARQNIETKMTTETNRPDHLLERQHSAPSQLTISDNIIDPTITTSFISMQQGIASGVQGMITKKDAIGITGPVHQLLQQNARTFNQISLNIATCQMHENIGLLSQTRDNIYKILNSLDDIPEMKQMPPLRIKVNEELASSILPPPGFRMKR